MLKILFNRFSKHKHNSICIPQQYIGVRLDQYLKKNGVSWSILHKALRNKQYYIIQQNNTQIRQPNYKISPNDRLFYPIEAQSLLKFGVQNNQDNFFKLPKVEAAKEIEKMLIFQNQNIIVLNKFANYSTQGGQDLSKNLFTILISLYNKQDIHILHRLDKLSSGIILFAKNQQTAKIIQSLINNKNNIHKFYIAKTQGISHKKQGLINSNIQWNNKKHKARLSTPSDDESKHAYTYFTKINQENNNVGTYLIKLLTGRKHQIRCHFSQYLQKPILNDFLYGGKLLDNELDNIYLHSYCTIIEDSEAIEKVFKNSIIKSQNGQVKIENNRLILKGLPRWTTFPLIPSEQQLNSQIIRLMDYNPKTQKTKFITY